MKAITAILLSGIIAFTGLSAQTWNTVYETKQDSVALAFSFSLGDDLFLISERLSIDTGEIYYKDIIDSIIVLDENNNAIYKSKERLKDVFNIGNIATKGKVGICINEDNIVYKYEDGMFTEKTLNHKFDEDEKPLVSANTLELFSAQITKPDEEGFKYYNNTIRKITKIDEAVTEVIYNEPIDYNGEIKIIDTGKDGYIIGAGRKIIHTSNRNIEGYFEEHLENKFLTPKDIKFDKDNNILNVVATKYTSGMCCFMARYLHSIVIFTYDMTEKKGRKKEFIVRDQEKPSNNSPDFYRISSVLDFELIEGVQFVNTDKGVFYNTGAGMEKLVIEGEQQVNSIRLIDDMVYAVTDKKVLVSKDLMSSVESAVAVDELKIYPNKIDKSVNTISIDMPTRYGFENLSVYTMNGNKVSEVDNYYELGSKYTFTVPSNLVSGMYFVKMSSDGTEYTAKLIVTD